MKTIFAKTLEKLAKKDQTVFLLTADLGFKLFDSFRNNFPDRFINVGVAEANMIGVATGMALSGKNVYCYSMIPFMTMRALEQIRVDICYHKLNVKLIGAGGGLVYGLEGMTHHAIEDLAIMRALANMTVVAPGDPFETEAVIEESATYSGPLYVRLGSNNEPQVHQGKVDISIGHGVLIREGIDLSIIATGNMLNAASIVADSLASKGLTVTLISMHTIKPLDTNLILKCADKSKLIITIEEHSQVGGLGSAVAEILVEISWRGRFKKLALPDLYCEDIGHADYLREKAGLSPEKILNRILVELERSA